MTDLNYGKHQATAEMLCKQGPFEPEILDYVLRNFAFDEQWGVTLEQKLIRLGVLTSVDLRETLDSWRSWLDRLEALAVREELDREMRARTLVKALAPNQTQARMAVFMWHAYDYSEQEFNEFLALIRTAINIRGNTGNKQIPLRLMEYDGSIKSMNNLLQVFETYKNHIERRVKLKHDARLNPSGIRAAIERLDAMRLKCSDDIN